MIPDPRDWKPNKPQCVHHNDADNCYACGTKGVSKGPNALLDTLPPVPMKPETPAAVVPSEKVVAKNFLEFLDDRDLTLEAAKQLPLEIQKELKNQFDAQNIVETISEERIKELLFGDLAYCVKHGSYEPCDVCAQNTINVQKLKDEEERIRRRAEAARRATQAILPAAEIPVPPPKSRGRPAGSKNLKLTELERKEEEARRGRERRKHKREQKAAIEEALKTPAAEVKRVAEENQLVEEKVLETFNDRGPDDDRGMSIPEAPSGKGQLITNVDLDAVERTIARAGLLGMPNDEEFWDTPDRRMVRPEGTGPDPDE